MLSVIASLFLFKTFISKMRQVTNAKIGTSDVHVNVTMQMRQNSKRLSLISSMVKLSCLVFFAMIFTLTSICITAYCVNTGSELADVIGMYGCALDVTISVTCLTLQWPFSQNVYSKLCRLCHHFIATKCNDKM